MPGAFDPYHEWLGIPAEEQPPDHYRILGVTRFESNPVVIDNAATRQMAHLRLFQAGPRGLESQRLLNEVAQARNCLLDPIKRASYDTTLHQGGVGSRYKLAGIGATDPHATSQQSEAPTTVPRFKSTPAASPKHARRKCQRRTSKSNPIREIIKVAVGGPIGIAIAFAVLHYGFQFDLRTFQQAFEPATALNRSEDSDQAQRISRSDGIESSRSVIERPSGLRDGTELQRGLRSSASLRRSNQGGVPASGSELARQQDTLDPEMRHDLGIRHRPRRNLEKHVLLPTREGSHQGAGLLLPFVVEPEDKVQLALLANLKTIPSSGRFAWKMDTDPNQGLNWKVGYSGDGIGLPVELAQLSLQEDGLHFEWSDEAEHLPEAEYLSNFVLRLQINTESYDVRLRGPIEVEPATMDLNRGIASVRWELPKAIDLSQCYLECLGLEKEFPRTVSVPVDRLSSTQGELWIRLEGTPEESGVVLHVKVERGRQVVVTVASYYFTGDITPPPQLINNRDARITTSNRRRWAKVLESRTKQAYEVVTAIQAIDPSTFTRTADRQEFEKRKSRAEEVLRDAQVDTQRLLNIDNWAGPLYQPAHLHFRVYYEVDGQQVDVLVTEGATTED